MMYPLSLRANDFAVGTVYTHFLAVDFADTYAISFTCFGVVQRNVRNMNRHGFLFETALRAGHRIRLNMLRYNVNTFDQYTVAIYVQYGATACFIAPCQYDNFVAFTDFLHILGSFQHFWCQRHDLHELLGTQLARNGAEETSTNRLQLSV